MAILKPRNRIVTFRVAEDEFEHLKNLSVAEGARSLSDYARTAVCNPPNGRSAAREVELDARVRKLDGKVDELDRAIKELTQLIGAGSGMRRADA